MMSNNLVHCTLDTTLVMSQYAYGHVGGCFLDYSVTLSLFIIVIEEIIHNNFFGMSDHQVFHLVIMSRVLVRASGLNNVWKDL